MLEINNRSLTTTYHPTGEFNTANVSLLAFLFCRYSNDVKANFSLSRVAVIRRMRIVILPVLRVNSPDGSTRRSCAAEVRCSVRGRVVLSKLHGQGISGYNHCYWLFCSVRVHGKLAHPSLRNGNIAFGCRVSILMVASCKYVHGSFTDSAHRRRYISLPSRQGQANGAAPFRPCP